MAGRIKGQVTLELTVSIFCMLLLLFGALQIFLWMNERLVRRQQDYNDTRISAASVAPDATQCTECWTDITWIPVEPISCDGNRGNWRFFCSSYYGPQCMSCGYAASGVIVSDPVCQSSVRPPERGCVQRGTATEIQVNESGYPRLDIFQGRRP